MRLNMNNKILDLIYCFDENYNIQGITSANSFLKNYTNQVRVHILHNNPNSIRSLSDHLKKFNNVEEVNIYEFKKPNDFVFRMNEEHIVTEATYYRLFIHEYLPDKISKVLYLDADVIAMNELTKIIDETFNQIKLSEHYFGAVDYIFSENKNNDIMLQSLNLNSGKYFNAGVLLIDYEKWTKHEMGKKILAHGKILIEEKLLKEHDQDILNSFFNGSFFSLDRTYNYPILERFYKKDLNKINSSNFIHYTGAQKPWLLNGLFNNISKYYQKSFIDIGINKRHVVFKNNETGKSILKKFKFDFLKSPWKLITYFHVLRNYLFKL